MSLYKIVFKPLRILLSLPHWITASLPTRFLLSWNAVRAGKHSNDLVLQQLLRLVARTPLVYKLGLADTVGGTTILSLKLSVVGATGP